MAVTRRRELAILITVGSEQSRERDEHTNVEPRSDAEPADTEPADTEPTDTEPTDAEPADTKSTDTKSAVPTTMDTPLVAPIRSPVPGDSDGPGTSPTDAAPAARPAAVSAIATVDPKRPGIDVMETGARGFLGRASEAVRVWSRRPPGRVTLGFTFVAATLAVAGAAGVFVVPMAAPRSAVSASTAPVQTGGAPPAAEQSVVPGIALPSGLPLSPSPQTGDRPADVLAAWAVPLAAKVGIPAVALQAYAYAELVAARNSPGCRLGWPTLAGIGKIESDHGRAGGARLNPDGKAVPAIIGPPLDGQSGRKTITDTDSGQLDTDRSWDRGVGPMQFIPSTWQQYAIDADTDGMSDVNDIDDASLAAANYLCAGNRDLSTEAGWKSAIRAYNNVDIYLQDVFDATNDYARRSRT